MADLKAVILDDDEKRRNIIEHLMPSYMETVSAKFDESAKGLILPENEDEMAGLVIMYADDYRGRSVYMYDWMISQNRDKKVYKVPVVFVTKDSFSDRAFELMEIGDAKFYEYEDEIEDSKFFDVVMEALDEAEMAADIEEEEEYPPEFIAEPSSPDKIMGMKFSISNEADAPQRSAVIKGEDRIKDLVKSINSSREKTMQVRALLEKIKEEKIEAGEELPVWATKTHEAGVRREGKSIVNKTPIPSASKESGVVPFAGKESGIIPSYSHSDSKESGIIPSYSHSDSKESGIIPSSTASSDRKSGIIASPDRESGIIASPSKGNNNSNVTGSNKWVGSDAKKEITSFVDAESSGSNKWKSKNRSDKKATITPEATEGLHNLNASSVGDLLFDSSSNNEDASSNRADLEKSLHLSELSAGFLNGGFQNNKQAAASSIQKETGILAAKKLGRRYRILIIDTDNKTERACKLFLEDVFDYTVVDSSMKAIDYFIKNTAELVIIDYNMPYVNGMQIFNSIKMQPYGANIKAIMLFQSGDDAAVMGQVASMPGIKGIVMKPLCKRPLVSAVETCLVQD